MSPPEEHVLKRIRALDEHIKSAEDRIAEDQVRIGNWKHERAALFDPLSGDAKKSLAPIAPDTSAIKPISPQNKSQSGSDSPEEKPKKEKTT